MTRINANIDPKDLTSKHLVAEYRELPMIHAALRKSLKTKSVHEVLKSIPKKFTLNTGHVRHFYNKLKFLDARYELLRQEMINRGMNPDPSRHLDVSGIPYVFFGDAHFDKDDNKIICDRLIEKVRMKPDFYKVDANKYAQQLVSKYC